MKLVVEDTYEAMSRAAAVCVAAMVARAPDLAVMPATGVTPMGLYRELAMMQSRNEVDMRGLRIIQLDAYVGVPDQDPRSLYSWMDRSLLKPLGIAGANVIRFEERAANLEDACRAYDAAVAAAGGVGLAILGLGPNGHLGFNEPPSLPDAPTRPVMLTGQSIASNASYWGGESHVPRRAMTAGMRTLLDARAVVLIVSGAHKHRILRAAIEGPRTPEVPGSFLQHHPNAILFADRAAWEGK